MEATRQRRLQVCRVAHEITCRKWTALRAELAQRTGRRQGDTVLSRSDNYRSAVLHRQQLSENAALDAPASFAWGEGGWEASLRSAAPTTQHRGEAVEPAHLRRIKIVDTPAVSGRDVEDENWHLGMPTQEKQHYRKAIDVELSEEATLLPNKQELPMFDVGLDALGLASHHASRRESFTGTSPAIHAGVASHDDASALLFQARLTQLVVGGHGMTPKDTSVLKATPGPSLHAQVSTGLLDLHVYPSKSNVCDDGVRHMSGYASRHITGHV